ncbi:hypothetical protein [Oceaniglobus indicus]|uniref:hypothetical protein n=1 Tax=Oceaniglobus indicus TaxID=2047749 RepID=UPI001882F33D|nr:hypothetical protein [Oceaniglobus indicus]
MQAETMGHGRPVEFRVPPGRNRNGLRWRYTAAVQLSDAGCEDAKIQAVTGHKTMEMVRKFRARREQKAASMGAQQKRDQQDQNKIRT